MIPDNCQQVFSCVACSIEQCDSSTTSDRSPNTKRPASGALLRALALLTSTALARMWMYQAFEHRSTHCRPAPIVHRLEDM
jgi:hypothetical protein